MFEREVESRVQSAVKQRGNAGSAADTGAIVTRHAVRLNVSALGVYRVDKIWQITTNRRQ